MFFDLTALDDVPPFDNEATEDVEDGHGGLEDSEAVQDVRSLLSVSALETSGGPAAAVADDESAAVSMTIPLLSDVKLANRLCKKSALPVQEFGVPDTSELELAGDTRPLIRLASGAAAGWLWSGNPWS